MRDPLPPLHHVPWCKGRKALVRASTNLFWRLVVVPALRDSLRQQLLHSAAAEEL